MPLTSEATTSAIDVTPSTSQEKEPDGYSTSSRDSGNDSSSSLNCDRRPLLSFPLNWSVRNGEEPLIVDDAKDSESIGDSRSLFDERWPEDPLKKELLGSKRSLISTTSVLCRICHVDASSSRDPLVSPCRCAGSMLHVHKSCLVHWLELSTRKMVPSPRCELCGYNYRRRNCWNLRGVHLPHMDPRDRILNCLFLFVFVIMCVCATLSIHFLQLTEQYHATIRGYRVVTTHLTEEDWTVIICSLLFFAAFFIAIFTQYRAEASIFRLIFRFWVINRNWTIRNYDIADDPEMMALREARERALEERRDVSTVKVPSPPPNTRIQPTMTVDHCVVPSLPV